MYHRVRPALLDGTTYPNAAGTILLDNFKWQIDFLKKHYVLLSQDEFLSCINNGFAFPRNAMLLTFDDGQADLYKFIYPALRAAKVAAIAFLPTKYIGTDDVYWWDYLEWCLLNTKLNSIKIFNHSISLTNKPVAMRAFEKIIKKNFAGREGEVVDMIATALGVSINGLNRSSINWDEVSEMANNGISFGGHTQNHVKLSETEDGLAKQEISASKAAIEQQIGSQVKLFAYPYGGPSDFLPIHEQLVMEAGYQAAFSTIDGPVNQANRLYSLKRIGVSGYDNKLTFRLKLTMKSDSLLVKVLRRLFK